MALPTSTAVGNAYFSGKVQNSACTVMIAIVHLTIILLKLTLAVNLVCFCINVGWYCWTPLSLPVCDVRNV